MSQKRTADAQIPLVSEHLQNLNMLQTMRSSLHDKTNTLEQEWNHLSEAQRQAMKQQIDHEQQQLMEKEAQVSQRSSELFSQYNSFESEKSTELQTLSQMRFTIRGDTSKTTRRCKVVKDFHSLQSKIKDLFQVGRDEKIILYHGNDVVGSEEELLFAFDDRLNELKKKEDVESTIEERFIAFEVVLAKQNVRKRRRRSPDVFEDSSSESNINCHRWTNEEIILFSEGVKEFGWSKWSRIAQTIPGRTEEQVRAFSRTSSGQEFKPNPIQTEMLKDILQGFRDTAAIARNVVTSNRSRPQRTRSKSPSPVQSISPSPIRSLSQSPSPTSPE